MNLLIGCVFWQANLKNRTLSAHQSLPIFTWRPQKCIINDLSDIFVQFYNWLPFLFILVCISQAQVVCTYSVQVVCWRFLPLLDPLEFIHPGLTAGSQGSRLMMVNGFFTCHGKYFQKCVIDKPFLSLSRTQMQVMRQNEDSLLQ